MARRHVIREFLDDVLDDRDGVDERPLAELGGLLTDEDRPAPTEAPAGPQAAPAEPVAAVPTPEAEAAAALDAPLPANDAPSAEVPVTEATAGDPPAADPPAAEAPVIEAPVPAPVTSRRPAVATPPVADDELELATGRTGLDAALSDLDRDGLLDAEDDDLDDDQLADRLDRDRDDDGIDDSVDDDVDDDGFEDLTEPGAAAVAVGIPILDPDAVVTVFHPGEHVAPATAGARIAQGARQATVADGEAAASSDLDGDGLFDRLDDDLDGDGLIDGVDQDDDEDGIADQFDIDVDGDGFADETEIGAASSAFGSAPGNPDDVVIVGQTDTSDTIARVVHGIGTVSQPAADLAASFLAAVAGEELPPAPPPPAETSIEPTPAPVDPSADDVVVLHRTGDPAGVAVTADRRVAQQARDAVAADGQFVAHSDLDRDGTVDLNDDDLDGDGLGNRVDLDDDDDGIVDTIDLDTDGDGFVDETEPGAFLASNGTPVNGSFTAERHDRDAALDDEIHTDQFVLAFDSAGEAIGDALDDAFGGAFGGLFGGDD